MLAKWAAGIFSIATLTLGQNRAFSCSPSDVHGEVNVQSWLIRWHHVISTSQSTFCIGFTMVARETSRMCPCERKPTLENMGKYSASKVDAHGSHFLVVCFLALVGIGLPGQNGRHFADDIFRCIFVNEKFCVFVKISLKFVPKGLIDNNPALVLIMASCRKGYKPLSEPMLTWFTDAYLCGIRGRRVKVTPFPMGLLPDT